MPRETDHAGTASFPHSIPKRPFSVFAALHVSDKGREHAGQTSTRYVAARKDRPSKTIERICGEPAFIHRQQEGMARESRKEPLMQGGGLCRGLQPLPHGG